jgi:hypothetical protein
MTTDAEPTSLLDDIIAAITPLDAAAAAAARVLRDMATFDSAGVSGEKA